MDDPVAFEVGQAAGEHLRVTVLRRVVESADDGFDYGSLVCRVEIRAEGMRAHYLATLRSEGFEKLRDDLAELDRAFIPGAVRFEPGYEEWIRFTITVAATGTVAIAGVAIDGLGSGAEQRLSFAISVEDSLRSILASAEAVANAFPRFPQMRRIGS